MSYTERVRHPSGALREQDEKRSSLWLWILLGIGAVIFGYFAWRKGWFGQPPLLPPPLPANPFGWK